MSRLGVRGIGSSTVANYGMVVGQALRTLLVARILGPADFGVLNIANLATNFTTYSDLGTGLLGQQHAAEARGVGQDEAARDHLLRAGRAQMWGSLVLSGLLLVAGTLLVSADAEIPGRACLFAAIVGPLQALWFAARGWLRVVGEFRLAMWAQWTQVAVWVLFVPLAAWRFGLLGALAVLGFSYLPPVVMSGRHCPVLSFMRPSYAAFRGNLRLGVPIWIMAVSEFAMVNVDQVLSGALLGAHALGLYSLAMLVTNALVAFSDGAAAAAHPQTLEAFARQDRRLHERQPSVVNVMVLVETAFALLVPLSWLGFAVLVGLFLPNFTEALPIIPVLTAGTCFVGVATASNSALLAVGLHRRVPALFALGIVVKIVLGIALVRAVADGPVALAASSATAAAIYGLGYLAMVAAALAVPGPAARWGFAIRHGLLGLILLACGAGTVAAHLAWGMRGFVLASAVTLVLVGAAYVLRWRRSHREVPDLTPPVVGVPDQPAL